LRVPLTPHVKPPHPCERLFESLDPGRRSFYVLFPMRWLLAILIVAPGCLAPREHRSPLLPDEFHLFASRSDFSDTGAITRADALANYGASSDGKAYTLGAGLTWDLNRPARRKCASYALPEIPELVTPQPLEPQPTPIEEPETLDDLAKLLTSLAALLAGVLSYFIRDRIPIVRDYTATGRARRAQADDQGTGLDPD